MAIGERDNKAKNGFYWDKQFTAARTECVVDAQKANDLKSINTTMQRKSITSAGAALALGGHRGCERGYGAIG